MNKIEIVKKLRALGPEFSADADGLEAYLQSSGERRFVIANAGTTNTGKSTLFNALLGRLEAFKTADVRETTVCRDIGWTQSAVFTDTPGCGSSSAADDRETSKAYQRADLVLFVHNLSTGGLKRDEMDVLEAVRRIMGERDFSERVLVIGTRQDECSDVAAEINRKECLELIKSEFGCELKFFAASPKRHFRGLSFAQAGENGKAQVFLEKGGIAALADALRAAQRRLGKRGMDRFDNLKRRIRALIADARKDYERLTAAAESAKAAAEAELAPLRAEIRRLQAA